jgi:hypothetical protein
MGEIKEVKMRCATKKILRIVEGRKKKSPLTIKTNKEKKK